MFHSSRCPKDLQEHAQSFNDHTGWRFESSEMGRCCWGSGFQILKDHSAFIFRVKGEHSTFTFRVKESWQQQKHWEHQISQYYTLLPYSACNTPLPRWSTLLRCQLAFSLSCFCLSANPPCTDPITCWPRLTNKSGCSCWTAATCFCNSFYFMTSSRPGRLTTT